MTEQAAERLRPQYQRLLQRHKRYVWFLAAILALALFFQTFVSVLVAAALVAIGSLSTIWRRIVRFNVGIELITPVFVIFSFAYSPIVAFAAAVLMTIAAAVISDTVGPTTFGRIAAYGLLMLFSFTLLGLDVVHAGWIMIVLFQMMIIFIYGLTYGFRFWAAAIPVAMNIATNFMIISAFAPALVSAL